MDHLEFLTRVRADRAWEKLPIVTVGTAQAKVMDAVGCGTSGYVRKPFTAEPIKGSYRWFRKLKSDAMTETIERVNEVTQAESGPGSQAIGRDFRFHIC